MGCAKVCGWILGCIGCCCCTIVLGFLLINLGVFGGFYFLAKTATSCNETELALAAEKCDGLGYQVTNLTAKSISRYGFDYNNKEISDACTKYTVCQKEHFCFQNTDKYKDMMFACAMPVFLAEKFSTCRKQLIDFAKKSDTSCLKFLIDEKTRCEKWDESRKCLMTEIKEICGEGIYKTVKNKEKFEC
ncbi:unnamed protein product [Caenorhabditis angaria]|uniref:T20D4.11-like domain-containing protein n=1 Tax=Caenorhabditis angaria TaxID=860376 RepID=A0A9P1IV26_9PELO|nr:unnamed protein product [Caenorhabditis angaria]